MKTKDQINGLFNDLAFELYHGFNFRDVLSELSDEAWAVLESIIRSAKKARNGESMKTGAVKIHKI